VIRDFHIIHEERGDRVATHPAGGRGVKEFSVLIPFQSISNFGPGLPIHGLLFDREVKSVHS
jgi:hypothetical protein